VHRKNNLHISTNLQSCRLYIYLTNVNDVVALNIRGLASNRKSGEMKVIRTIKVSFYVIIASLALKTAPPMPDAPGTDPR
jgi:hypothetical protein